MNEALKYLTKDKDTIEYLTFFVLLEKIKYIPPILEYCGDDFVEYMIELLPRIDDKYDRASLIETIVQSYYWDENSVGYSDELFNEYIRCIRDHATNLDDIISCLNGFVHAGVRKQEIVIQLIKHVDKEKTITILSRFELDDVTGSPGNESKLLTEAKEISSIRWRSGIIAQFLLLVHPQVRKYAGISQITFLYDTYHGVYADCWPRGLLPNQKELLLNSKVLSAREISVLETLEELINSQEKDLDSPEVKQLYDAFFAGKDPLDVIFTLPK
ncbi:hypothetical protein ASD24_16860 [Paenibacillus sp. Root52]|uniref:Uncharacterized protein n=1 Tax=Paenibacillus amylolyticus TaxID=1451 RepID=A0AAP5LPT9_PAEAM|nr:MULTISPECIES: hypothetical protein [Paenibacillus]KQY80610.1 hypothetical protein ASD24_16860 [Paenibacillus sp. Root52]MDR6724833.1 hypothetical protein [Paenibacillus amylolyticus]